MATPATIATTIQWVADSRGHGRRGARTAVLLWCSMLMIARCALRGIAQITLRTAPRQSALRVRWLEEFETPRVRRSPTRLAAQDMPTREHDALPADEVS